MFCRLVVSTGWLGADTWFSTSSLVLALSSSGNVVQAFLMHWCEDNLGWCPLWLAPCVSITSSYGCLLRNLWTRWLRGVVTDGLLIASGWHLPNQGVISPTPLQAATKFSTLFQGSFGGLWSCCCYLLVGASTLAMAYVSVDDRWEVVTRLCAPLYYLVTRVPCAYTCILFFLWPPTCLMVL